MVKPFFLLMRWFQMIPIAMLMLTPFEDRQLRVSRRVGLLLSAAYMVFAGVVLAIVSQMVSVDGRRNIIARDLCLAAVLAVYFFGWACAVCAPAAQKFLVAVIMFHYAAVLNAMSNVSAYFILGKSYLEIISGEAGSLTFDLCLLTSTAMTWPLVWYFLRHILLENLPGLDDRQVKRGLSYMCVVFLLFSAATYYPPYEIQPEMSIVIGAMTVTDMVAYYIFFQEVSAARRQEAAIRHLELYQMQYQEISSRVEEARRLRHDMRHHIITLAALNAQGKQGEIADYLEKYGAVYGRLEEYRMCGDPVAESVLGYYLALAREEGTNVNCKVTLNAGIIDPMDMTVLLGNCLENAMEALRQVPRDRRRLDIDIRTSGGVLLLQVINSCDTLNDTGGVTGWEHFLSGKRRGKRGLGLQSIADSAQKYGGNARFQQKDGLFTVQVVLNLP